MKQIAKKEIKESVKNHKRHKARGGRGRGAKVV